MDEESKDQTPASYINPAEVFSLGCWNLGSCFCAKQQMIKLLNTSNLSKLWGQQNLVSVFETTRVFYNSPKNGFMGRICIFTYTDFYMIFLVFMLVNNGKFGKYTTDGWYRNMSIKLPKSTRLGSLDLGSSGA